MTASSAHLQPASAAQMRWFPPSLQMTRLGPHVTCVRTLLCMSCAHAWLCLCAARLRGTLCHAYSGPRVRTCCASPPRQTHSQTLPHAIAAGGQGRPAGAGRASILGFSSVRFCMILLARSSSPVDDVHLAAVLGQEARLLHRRVAAADDRQRLAPEHGRGAVAHRARADPLVPEAVDLARAREVQPPRDRACAQDAQFRYQSPPVAFIRTQALHSASPQSLHFGEPCTSSGRGRCCTPGLCTTAYAQHSRHCHGKHALVYSLPFRNC